MEKAKMTAFINRNKYDDANYLSIQKMNHCLSYKIVLNDKIWLNEKEISNMKKNKPIKIFICNNL